MLEDTIVPEPGTAKKFLKSSSEVNRNQTATVADCQPAGVHLECETSRRVVVGPGLCQGETVAQFLAAGEDARHDPEEIEAVSRLLSSGPPEAVLWWGIERYGDGLALCTSFQAEGMVLLDMAWNLDPTVRVFTIDTGRLPPETYDLIDEVRERYGAIVDVYSPDAIEVGRFVTREGVNPFYRSLPLRLRCCDLRKTKPLERALEGLDCWVTGLRRDQSTTRSDVRTVELDRRHPGLIKLNPLATWNEDQVWEYVRRHDIPYNRLYDQGYRSIGCAPCTRPCAPGEDARAGRWWWEEDMPKECGLHWSPR
jgi:thioredoxin-dependent adenylylsulfate APS reductase